MLEKINKIFEMIRCYCGIILLSHYFHVSLLILNKNTTKTTSYAVNKEKGRGSRIRGIDKNNYESMKDG